MANPRGRHHILIFDRVMNLEGRMGHCIASNLREVTVSYDVPDGAAPALETRPQFDNSWCWVGRDDPWDHDEWPSPEDAEERIRRLEWDLDDIQDEIDELYSRQSAKEDELAELEEALAKYKAALRKVTHV